MADEATGLEGLDGADASWSDFFARVHQRVASTTTIQACGSLSRAAGLTLEARGLRLPVGAPCQIEQTGFAPIPCEVVGFDRDRLFLMPAGRVQGLQVGARVRPARAAASPPGMSPTPEQPVRSNGTRRPLGDGLIGRVVDAFGQPMDHAGPLLDVAPGLLDSAPVNAMDRAPIDTVLATGVRAIDGLLTIGRGQRIGLFAGSGVGKSVLLGMMARYTAADVIVVGLVGERGREVREFIEHILGDEGRARSVVVAAPADAPPLARLQGASYASAVAEHFRDQGRHVLLLMDSLTRYAMAQREIGLAIGEAPATKGYPASCFSLLPRLVERSGNGPEGGGSITAIYTVLSEGDDQQDPVADAARAILDGHIVLSRSLAESGHFPAIDVEQSASRVMHNITSPAHQAWARAFRVHLARHNRARMLLQLGAYTAGTDPALDQALALHEPMQGYLQQDMHEHAEQSVEHLQALFQTHEPH